MTASVAVIAHSGKTLGGGLAELRDTLRESGVTDPLWLEIAKGKQATGCAKQVRDAGVELVYVWGGDGTVQRVISVMAGSDTTVAIVPAGTANLLARNLEIPTDIAEAVAVGLHGAQRRIDTGVINGEHFAVMAGAGLDALMIDEADAGLKDRFGRVAYLWTGARNLGVKPATATVELEGRRFYRGSITCILFGNLSDVGGNITLFDGSRADDGLLEFGVVKARNRWQWTRTIGRVLVGRAENSPFVLTGRGTTVRVRFDRAMPYELDGGARPATRTLKVRVAPASTRVCMPAPRAPASSDTSPAG